MNSLENKNLSRAKYKINEKFGKLIILKYLGNRKYLCKCECGNETIARSRDFINGSKRSCGCLRTVERNEYDTEIKNKLLDSIIISPMHCWIWQKSKHCQGYGQIFYKNKYHLAHRVAWIIFNGIINHNMKILHKCDNPSCINSDHLFIGTQRDNIKDMFKKRRSKLQKLSEEDVLDIRLMDSKNFDRIQIAKKYAITISNLCHILKNKTWKN